MGEAKRTHFAFRAAVETTITETKNQFLFSSKEKKDEIYWPGLFIVRDTKKVDGQMVPTAHFRVRADRRGGDFMGPEIPTMGWWTLGISFTPDGLVHYFAKPGVEDTDSRRLHRHSHAVWIQGGRVRSFFYNVVNGDNGKDWSTDWIVDDPKFYIIKNERMAKRN